MTTGSNRTGFISVRSLGRPEIENIFQDADGFYEKPHVRPLDGRIVAPMFFQPSTRTRLGFEVAALRLGASVAGFADPNSTRASAATQESFEDTIRTVAEYADVIVVRSGREGAGALAASLARCPVINAGDAAEHPTQALIDAFAMRRLMPRPVEGATIGFTGCHSNRCTRPLVRVLSELAVRRMVMLVEPGREPDAEVVAVARERGVEVDATTAIEDLLVDCDAISAAPRDTRFIKDPSHGYAEEDTLMPPSHVVTAEAIRRTGSKAVILHPLPRRNEISTCVDPLPNAGYFRQVGLSVPLRMAILARAA